MENQINIDSLLNGLGNNDPNGNGPLNSGREGRQYLILVYILLLLCYVNSNVTNSYLINQNNLLVNEVCCMNRNLVCNLICNCGVGNGCSKRR